MRLNVRIASRTVFTFCESPPSWCEPCRAFPDRRVRSENKARPGRGDAGGRRSPECHEGETAAGGGASTGCQPPDRGGVARRDHCCPSAWNGPFWTAVPVRWVTVLTAPN